MKKIVAGGLLGAFALALFSFIIPQYVAHATGGVDCNLVTDATPSECTALVEIYDTNTFADRSSYAGWYDGLVMGTPDDTVCDWMGVTCTNGSITALSLMNLTLESIPDSVGINLTSLDSLQIVGTNITVMPGTIAYLSALTTLDLSNNRLQILPSIGDLQALQIALFDHNEIIVIDGFTSMPNLSTLALDNNNLVHIEPNAFDGLTAISNFYIDNNYLLKSSLDESVTAFLDLYAGAWENAQTIENDNILSNLQIHYDQNYSIITMSVDYDLGSGGSVAGVSITLKAGLDSIDATHDTDPEWRKSAENGHFRYGIRGGEFVQRTGTIIFTGTRGGKINTGYIYPFYMTISPGYYDVNESNNTLLSTYQWDANATQMQPCNLMMGEALKQCKNVVQLVQDNPSSTLTTLSGWSTLLDPIPFITSLCDWEGITCGNKGNAIVLNLSGRNISTLSTGSINALSSVRELYLNNNNLTTLPESFEGLYDLQILDLSHNQLSELPRDFASMQSLVSLFINNNQFSEIPNDLYTIGSFNVLNILDVSNNHISSISSNIYDMYALMSLNVSNNHLTTLPSEIGSLSNLTALFFSGNHIESLSNGIFTSIGNSLSSIDASYNYLSRDNLATSEVYLLDLLQPDWEDTQFLGGPFLRTVLIGSTNNDPSYAIPGDTVYVGIIANEELDINTIAINIAGQLATVEAIAEDCDGYCYIGSIIVDSNTTPGLASFTVNYQNLSGNVGDETVATTDQSSVYIDTAIVDQVGPTINYVTITSDNQYPTLAAEGNTITLSFGTDEELDTNLTQVSIQGVPVSLNSCGGFCYFAELLVDGSTVESEVEFTIDTYDLSGNPGASAALTTDSSTVTIDRATPTISTVHIQSDNIDSSIAFPDNTITLSFESNEELEISNFSDSLGNNWLFQAGNSCQEFCYEATITVDGNFIDGPLTFAIDGTDLAGNTIPQITDTTDQSSVSINMDNQGPSINFVHIQSNNSSNTGLATLGNIITVSFGTNEELDTSASQVTIEGDHVTLNSCGEGCYEATLTVDGNTDEGNVTFAINTYDLSLNAGGSATATTDNSRVTIDRTTPTLSNIHIESSHNPSNIAQVGDTLTLFFQSDEELDLNSLVYEEGVFFFDQRKGDLIVVGCEGYCYQATVIVDDQWTGTSPGFSINVKDFAGNYSTEYTQTTDGSQVLIDITHAIISNIHIESNNAYNTGLARSGDIVTLSFKSNEQLHTGSSNAIFYNINSGNITTDIIEFSCSGGFCYRINATIDHMIDTTTSFLISAVDMAGNRSNDISTTSDSSNVLIDNTPLSYVTLEMYSDNNIDSIAFSGNRVNVLLQTTEAIQTGSLLVRIAGTTGTLNTTGINCFSFYCYETSIIVSPTTPNGPASLFIRYADKAGNISNHTGLALGGDTVSIDTQVPTISLIHLQSNNQYNTGIATSNVPDTITLFFRSNEELDTNRMSIDLNGSTPDSFTEISCETYCYSGSWQTNPSWEDGIATISLTYADIAGNINNASSTTDGSSIIIDNTPATMISFTGTSNNMDPFVARSGNRVSVSFETDEAISTGLSHIIIDGESTNVQKITCGAGFCYSGSLIIDNNNTNGLIAIDVEIYDYAGNYSQYINASLDIRVDTINPTIGQLNIYSDNTDNTYAISGDTIYVYFESDEILSSGNVVVVVAGQTGTLESIGCSDTCYTFSLLVSTLTPSGNPSFTISYKDLVGNNGTQNTGTYSLMNIDSATPHIDIASLYSSNNTNGNYAISGDVITLRIDTNKVFDINNIYATIAGQTVNMVEAGCGGSCFEGTLTIYHDTLNGSADISVSYIDSRGNAASDITTTTDSSSIIIDTALPSITFASLSSTNSDGSIAMESDQVFLDFESDEALDMNTMAITIGGQSAAVEELSCSGFCYRAMVIIDENFSEGDLDITIGYSDIAGNNGHEQTSTTDSSFVQVTRAPVTLTYVHIASNNTNNTALAKSGDNIILSFRGSEALDINSIDVDINGQSASIATGSCGSYCYTATVGASHLFSNPVSFTIDYTNLIGAAGQQVTEVNDGSSVTIDNQAPSLVSANIRSSNGQTGLATSGNIIMVSFKTDEILLTGSISLSIANKSGSAVRMPNCAGFCYSGSIVVDSATTPGTVAIGISYKDAAGNSGVAITATTDSSSVDIDASLPTLSNIFLFSNHTYSTGAKSGDKITLLFTASEALMTGTLSGLIAGKGASLQRMSCGGFCYSGSITVDGTTNNGIAGIRIQYADIAGNTGAVRTALTSGTVNIDTQKPTLNTIHIFTDNTNPVVGENGDTIYLTFRSNEQLDTNNLVITLGGQSANVSQTACDGYCYTAETDIDNNMSAGAVSIGISYQDIIGNIGDSRTATTDSSSVTISICAGVLDVSESECKTMTTFAIGLSGTSISTMSGWSAARGTNAISNICDWQGISCAGGHIVGIDLSSNTISSLPNSIASLPYLTAIDISNNNFSTVPTAILSMSNLEFLSIAHNELITIPGGTFSSLNNLNVIDVSYNHLARTVMATTETNALDTYQVNWEDTQTILSDSTLTTVVLTPASGAQMTGSTLTLGVRYSQGTGGASFTGSIRVELGTGMTTSSSNNGWTSLGDGVYTYRLLPTYAAQNDNIVLFTGAFIPETETGVIYDFVFSIWSGYDADDNDNTLTGSYFWIDTVLPTRNTTTPSKETSAPTFSINALPPLRDSRDNEKPDDISDNALSQGGNGSNAALPSPPATVYRWAHANGVTTMPLSNARLYVPVQRYEAATMIVNYVKNVQQQEIEPRKECDIYQYKDINTSINEGVRSVIQDICNLGLMGRGATADTLTTSFRPYDTLSTKELQIILKRYDRASLLKVNKNRRIDVMDLLMRTLK